MNDGATAAADQADELPYAHGPVIARGLLRARPEDFQVEEIPVCLPDGAGEHVWLRVRKRGANTEWVARQLARHAGVAPRDVSFAGLKDRHAVTEQWFSLHLPGRADPDWSGFAADGVEIRETARHSRKLRRGALRGNRFALRLREVAGDREALAVRLAAVAERGVPNYFGPQRFGRDGGNLQGAADLFAGRLKGLPRHLRGLYLSAARAQLFNRVLARRVVDGNWDRGLAGDLLQPEGSHGRFAAAEIDVELAGRVMRGEVHPTGPLWGRGDTETGAACRELETAVLAPFAALRAGLEAAGLEQERRALRVMPRELAWEWEGADALVLRFGLPAGAYATMVVREVVDCQLPAGAEAEGEPC